jgi:hypothetical protein
LFFLLYLLYRLDILLR